MFMTPVASLTCSFWIFYLYNNDVCVSCLHGTKTTAWTYTSLMWKSIEGKQKQLKMTEVILRFDGSLTVKTSKSNDYFNFLKNAKPSRSFTCLIFFFMKIKFASLPSSLGMNHKSGFIYHWMKILAIELLIFYGLRCNLKRCYFIFWKAKPKTFGVEWKNIKFIIISIYLS